MPDTAAVPAAATIVAGNYVPAARVLAESYLRHHPGGEFTVLVIDAEAGSLPDIQGIRWLGPADLDIDPTEFGRMAMSYTVTELCTAVKPWLLRRLLAEHELAIYLDPDIEVFAPFAGEVAALAAEHDIVLTPHVLEPMPRDGLRPTEADIMASGVFNLGFIGISRGAARFLDFWSERLRQDAISAITEQLFTDQRWVDNVPAMFRHTVIADPGFNVAYWNVYQRRLAAGDDGVLTAAGAPVRFYHFSGYRPDRPWLASSHYADRPRLLLSEHPLLARLFTDYGGKLMDAGYAQALQQQYGWAALTDGTPVSASLRRTYRQAWVQAERTGAAPPPNPFDPAGSGEFLRWATTPADLRQRRAGLNPWAIALWQTRADLQTAFPDPLGANAAGYRNWCATTGVAEGELHRGAVEPARERPVTTIDRTPGVNVLGYLTAELGVGEMGRLVHEAVLASGLPVATTVEELTVANRTNHPAPEGTGEPRHGVSVLCVNADMTSTTLRLHPELGRDRYVIGVWSWELATFPAEMREAFRLVDEVWAISDFCASAFSRGAPVPVHTFPVPVRDPLAGWPRESREPRPAGEPVTFLFVFDHNSVFERKNPVAAVTAFQRAFAGRTDVRLVIKSINGEQHLADRERLRAAVADDARIELIERYLDHDEVHKLFAQAHGYLSLHRSEGFGLTVAEAMAHGLAVIATDHSGTSELLTADTGWPIPYRTVPVGPGNEPYPAGATWAEPDLAAAAAALREVAGDPELAHRRGLAARHHVLATRSPQAAAAWVRERLLAAHERWLAAGTRAMPVTEPVLALRRAREALRWRADPAMPSRLPLAPAMRRLVLRALDHYDHHQRTVQGALMDGVEDGLGGVIEQVGQLEGRLAGQLTRQLAEQLAEQLGRVTELLRERDERLDALERELANQLPAVRAGLLRHHKRHGPAPAVPAELVATDTGVLWLPADDTVLLPWMRTYGSWERLEARLVDLLLPAGGTFVDIGAHVGYFTVRALARTGRDGAVYAVEPGSHLRELLDLNVAANLPADVAATLTVLPVAAWDRTGPLRLALAKDGNSGDNRIDPCGEVPVNGARLDEVDGLAGCRVDVVKCDVQGHDHRALAGLSEIIRAHRPHVLCEFDPARIAGGGGEPEQVLAQYRAWGYQPLPVTPEVVERAERVDVAQSGGLLGVDRTDRELVELAAGAGDGFVTLWLRPAQSGS